MEFNTLEEACAEIVRLTDELAQRTADNETLSKQNETLSNDLAHVRSINQQYFNRLMAQDSDQAGKNHDNDEEAPTCEEFAKTLNI